MNKQANAMHANKVGSLRLAGLFLIALSSVGLGASVVGSNTGNVAIPDATASGPGAYVSSTIAISGAPAGAVVTGIDVYFKCVHAYGSDLTVDLNADSTGSLGNYRLWSQAAGANPTKTTTGISTFNGLSVNRTWYLYARDWVQFDTGYIDEWTITIYYNNATPTISSVSPNPVTGSNSGQSLTVNGSGFVSGAQVKLAWPAVGSVPAGNATFSATFNSSSQLQVNGITFANDPGTWTAQVINPGPVSSSTYSFSVQAPFPVITSLSPSSATAGGAAFNMTVNGVTFDQGSIVRWNGANLTTTPTVSAGGLTTSLTAQVPASDIASPGTPTVTVYNPSPGGGTSSGTTFTVNPGGPTITSVSPNPVTGSNSGQSLTVNGSGFVSGATVKLAWPAVGVVPAGNATFSATFNSSSQLQVNGIVFANDPGTWTAQAINPGPVSSSAYSFSVQTPFPVITSLSPSSAAAGGAAFNMTVNGVTFDQGSIVRWNGANLTTTPTVSAGGLTTSLTAQVPASDIASPGTPSVTVYSPAPGGGTSSGVTFAINSVNLPAPTLSAPVNGSTGQSTTPAFSWSDVSGATSYRMLVATSAGDLPTDPTASSGGASVVINATPTTATYTPLTALSPGTTYYWEVHGRNSTQYGDWSSVFSFTTAQNNQAPTHGIASQVRADSGVAMADPNGTVPQGVGVYFRVTPSDADGDTARMEVELHLLPATFTGAATLFSSYVNSGTLATTATANGLGAGSYGWRYRVVDIRGAAGAWVSENHPDFIVQGAGPSITGVSPNPVTGANASQPFYVNGANFVSGCNVTLRDLTAGGAPFANMPIAALSSTQIRINPNFTTAAHSWSVEVINPGPLSSGQYNFSAVQPASCLYVDDYPYPNGNPYDPNNTGDETTIDPWRFYNRQCTSYVAWKLNKAAGITKDPWFFYNLMGGHHFSDAGNWAANATALGFLVNNTPSVGAVAHWGYGELGSLGHVAYVEAVNDDGTVNVSEYNRSQANTFGTHCHDSPPRFIHVRDVAGGGGGGPSAPVVSSPKVEGNAVTVSAPSEAGVSYVLESKTSMSDASWTSVATNAGSGGQITLTNAGAAGQRRVYRLRLQ